MFYDIPAVIQERMRYLEEIDARDREDGTPKSGRLRQVTPDTGQLLALLAAFAPPGIILEVGTSAGYSTLWLALAARQVGQRIVTFELDKEKAARARETFATTGVEDVVELVVGDALERLPGYSQVSLCFVDTEKDLYGPCYETVVPNLVPGGLLVADNTTSHAEELSMFLERAHTDPRMDAITLPVGKGVLVSRKI